jgi:hypothetical protein
MWMKTIFGAAREGQYNIFGSVVLMVWRLGVEKWVVLVGAILTFLN